MKNKKSTDSDNFKISELMLVKADWERTFIAAICREITSEGVSIVRGTVVVNEGKIWSAGTQIEIGKFFDDICLLKLDYKLHSNTGVSTEIFGGKYFLN